MFCVFLHEYPFSFSNIIQMRPPVLVPLAPNLLPLGSRNGEHAHTVFAELPAGPHSDRKGVMKPLAPRERVTGSPRLLLASGQGARGQRPCSLSRERVMPSFPGQVIYKDESENCRPPFASLVNDVWFDLFSFS